MRSLVPWMCLLAAGCGARSELGGLDASPPIAPDDASIPRLDAARPDAARADAAVPSGCVAEVVEVATTAAQVDYPCLARDGEDVMLVVTQTVDDGPPTLLLLPLDLGLRPRGDFRTIGPGQGGTLVSSANGPGFVLAFRNSGGQLANARFDGDGGAIAVAPLGDAIAGVRSLFVVTPRLVAVGFDPATGPSARGSVTEIGGPSARYALEGRAPVGARGERDDVFVAATTDGEQGILERIDASGRSLGTRRLTPGAPSTFPISLTGARVVDGAPDAAVLHGGVVRALEQMFLQLSVGDTVRVWDPVGDLLFDEVASAYGGGWLATSFGALHDEGISRAPTPHVFFRALGRDGREAELTLAGPLFTAPEPFATPVRTAITTAGSGVVMFLVVWTWNEQDVGHIGGARLVCSLS